MRRRAWRCHLSLASTLSVSFFLLFALSAHCHVSCSDSAGTLTRAVLPMHGCIGYSAWTGGALSGIAAQPTRCNKLQGRELSSSTCNHHACYQHGRTQHRHCRRRIRTHHALSPLQSPLQYLFSPHISPSGGMLPLQISSHCIVHYILYSIMLFSTSYLC